MSKSDELDRRALASATAYMGGVAWPTIVFGVLAVTSYLGSVALALVGAISLPLAVPLVAFLTYLNYTVLHESAHGSISGGQPSMRWLNESLGYISAWILMIPLTAHRAEHMAHHRHTNDASSDPDYHIGRMRGSFPAAVRAALRAIVSQFTYYRANRWDSASRKQNLILCIEVAAALLPRVSILFAGFWLEGLALFVLAWLLGATMLLYLFAYIVHRPHDRVGRYSSTSTILLSQWLHTPVTWFWVFQNYHSIHHLFPRVPFYKYAQLYEEIEDIMVAKGAPVYRLTLRGLEARNSEAGWLPEPVD